MLKISWFSWIFIDFPEFSHFLYFSMKWMPLSRTGLNCIVKPIEFQWFLDVVSEPGSGKLIIHIFIESPCSRLDDHLKLEVSMKISIFWFSHACDLQNVLKYYRNTIHFHNRCKTHIIFMKIIDFLIFWRKSWK